MNQKITWDTGWVQCKMGQRVTGRPTDPWPTWPTQICWPIWPMTHWPIVSSFRRGMMTLPHPPRSVLVFRHAADSVYRTDVSLTSLTIRHVAIKTTHVVWVASWIIKAVYGANARKQLIDVIGRISFIARRRYASQGRSRGLATGQRGQSHLQSPLRKNIRQNNLFYLKHSHCTLNCTQSFNGGETPWMSHDATNPLIWHP